jgi:hypothetical protein
MDYKHPVRDDRAGFRRRQFRGVDAILLADLVLGLEILRQHLGGSGVGRRLGDALRHAGHDQNPDRRDGC